LLHVFSFYICYVICLLFLIVSSKLVSQVETWIYITFENDRKKRNKRNFFIGPHCKNM